MAKIQCDYCGYETEDMIDVCPYCGHEMPKQLTLFEETAGNGENDYVVLAESYSNFRESAIRALMDIVGLQEDEAIDVLATMPTTVVRGVSRTVAMTIARSLTDRNVESKVYLSGEEIPFDNINNTRFTAGTIERKTPFVTGNPHPATGDSIYNAYSGRLRRTGDRSPDNPPLRVLRKK